MSPTFSHNFGLIINRDSTVQHNLSCWRTVVHTVQSTYNHVFRKLQHTHKLRQTYVICVITRATRRSKLRSAFKTSEDSFINAIPSEQYLVRERSPEFKWGAWCQCNLGKRLMWCRHIVKLTHVSTCCVSVCVCGGGGGVRLCVYVCMYVRVCVFMCVCMYVLCGWHNWTLRKK